MSSHSPKSLFIRLAAPTLAVAVMAGAASAEMTYQEAPTLAQLVADGKLPPVEERLPDEPEVITMFEALGQYGDEFRFGISGYHDHEQIQNWAGNMGPIQLDPDTHYTTALPLAAGKFEVSDDAKVYTFSIRKGHKWSDGTLFTTADVDFSVSDILLHPDLAPISAIWSAGGEVFELNIIDELTFQFIFSQPYGDFLYEIADRDNLHPTFYQKAYCSRAHPDYNENLEADLADNNLTDWRDYLLQLCGNPGKSPTRWGNPDRPSLEAWVVVEPYSGGATQVVLERNPYFWQVDEEGRQLPYVDRLIGTVYADPEGLLLGAVAGNVDYGQRKLEAAANRPALAEAAPRISAKLYDVTAIGGSSCWFQLNLTHKDPDLNWLFNEKDFRIALSIGFDRQEVIDTALLGEGIPWNNGPFEDSPMFHEQYATQYLEFDPEKANELLDGIGLTERNSDGIRLMPNGRPVSFTAEITVARNDIVDQLEIMSAHWRQNIGVEMRINATERALMYAKVDNNDHDATAWDDNASWGPGRFPSSLVPAEFNSRWAIGYAQWYKSGGEQGMEPPDHIKDRFALYENVKTSRNFEERRSYVLQMADIAAEKFETFGVSKMMSNRGIVKSALRNVRSWNPSTSQFPPALQRPWTFWWDTPDGNRPQN